MMVRRTLDEAKELRERIVAWMRRNPTPVRPVTLAWNFRMKQAHMGQQLKMLSDEGRVKKVDGTGRYVIAEEARTAS